MESDVPDLHEKAHITSSAAGKISSKRIWVFLTSKHGDNAQSLSLAQALALPFEIRKLQFGPKYERAKPKVRASIHHVDGTRSDSLSPPWPDLIIVTGRRPSMAALWVKEQSGGRTKIVLIGRPKACFDQFDLILAAAHYQLPEGRKNVLRSGLPLVFIPPDKLQDARQAWSDRLAGLQRPITVLCFGGSTGARPLDLATVRQILLAARRTAPSGTLYVLTSRRTPTSAYAEIKAQLPHNGMFYGWKDKDTENPYLGLLALGNRFIVTGDSISMLVEVVRLGKPLAIAALPPKGGLIGLTKRILSRLGGAPSRDFDLLHRHLYDRGWAVPLGREFITPQTPPPDDSKRAAERIRQLLFSG